MIGVWYTTMSIYGKNTKNLRQNHESFEAESCYIASKTQGLPRFFFSKYDCKLTIYLFMVRSNLRHYTVLGGKC